MTLEASRQASTATLSNSHYLTGTCSFEKYSPVIFFRTPVNNIMDIKLGNVMIPKAASPNAHIVSSSAIPPTKVKKTYTYKYGTIAFHQIGKLQLYCHKMTMQ